MTLGERIKLERKRKGLLKSNLPKKLIKGFQLFKNMK